MRFVPRYALAPTILFALQGAPVAVVPDSNGWYRIAVGGELGSYLERSVSCSGEVLDEERVKFRSVGGELEVWVAPDIRLAGHAGQIWAAPNEGGQIAPPYEGFFGGALVAFEGTKLGIGGGISAAPVGASGSGLEQGLHAVPIVYLRVGRLDKLHARVDLGGPAAPGMPPDVARWGLASGRGWIRKPSWDVFVGLADFPVNEGPGAVMGARVMWPVASALDLGAAAAWREPSGGNFGVLGRMHFGKRR